VNKDLQDIVFVPKFGKDGICSTPVSEAKVNNINTVGNDCNAVCHNKNPFCSVLICFSIPEPERNNLHKQIYGVSVG
jgi:hypothetical protein